MFASYRNNNLVLDSNRDRVESILALITATANDAMKEYEKNGYDVPSPDSTYPHPLDTAYDTMTTLTNMLRILEGACQQLCTTLSLPAQTMSNRMMMSFEPACLSVVSRAKVADLLDKSKEGMHVKEIAKRTPIKDENKLARIMRLLALRGCFREVSANVFANNRLSLTLLSSNPHSAAVSIWTQDFTKGLGHLYDTLTNDEYGLSEEPTKSAFMYSVKSQIANGTLWDWYELHPGKREVFGKGMIGWSDMTGAVAAIKSPIWRSLPKGSTICDVGSGVGGFTIHLAKEHPHLKITLCDRPEVIAQAEEFWKMEYPEAIQERRVNFVPINFFQEILEGQDVYFARHIIHDWADPKASLILKNIRKAMHSNSKLLIQECVLPHSDDTHFLEKRHEMSDLALQALNAGSSRLYNLDLTVLVMLNSRERTLAEYAQLCLEADVRFQKHWDYADTSLLEFSVVEQSTARL